MIRRLILTALTVICPGLSWADGPADEAFALGDYTTARSLWQQEAAQGEAEAMLGLGLLADRGFGQERDLAVAFDWYRQAADLGLAEAQFNVGVMLDAGLGQPRDALAAQVWYTRAALRGHARAQYNLALLFETGDGLAANPRLAKYWFDRASSSLPAAAGRTIAPSPLVTELVSPEVLFSEYLGDRFEVVWSAGSSESSTFLLESIAIPNPATNYTTPVLSETTASSGLLDSVPETSSDDLIWRVLNISADASDYAASDWIVPPDDAAPLGRITFLYDPEIPAMADATAFFAETLRSAGYWVRNESLSSAERTGVYIAYSYASDADLAQKVAGFLPSGPAPVDRTQLGGLSQPGEIIIDLAAYR